MAAFRGIALEESKSSWPRDKEMHDDEVLSSNRVEGIHGDSTQRGEDVYVLHRTRMDPVSGSIG